MDPSALIFIALAVAWAIYLIPKALEHHDESVRTRTVEKFSATMRVLARREPISRRRARLVPAARTGSPADRADSTDEVESAAAPVRRTVPVTAAQRRRRVLTGIVLALVVVAALAAVHVLAWVWVVAPLVVLVAWLVACRLMVKNERRAAGRARPRSPQPGPTRRAPKSADFSTAHDMDRTGPIDAVAAEPNPATAAAGAPVASAGEYGAADPRSWDPVPVTLPTYVSKPAAPRSVRTIDLDSTGVWSSGRSESDSELVRESSARETTEKAADDEASRRRRHA